MGPKNAGKARRHSGKIFTAVRATIHFRKSPLFSPRTVSFLRVLWYRHPSPDVMFPCFQDHPDGQIAIAGQLAGPLSDGSAAMRPSMRHSGTASSFKLPGSPVYIPRARKGRPIRARRALQLVPYERLLSLVEISRAV